MTSEKKIIGVVGAGAMGRGIAQLFADAGHIVRIHDAMDGAAQKAREFIAQMLSRAVEKGRYTAKQAETVVANIHVAAVLADLSGCDVVIEAIVETIDAKQKIFTALEAIVSERALIVSNTSSLTVADIAAACKHPQRVAGLHFFNPVPLMKVVEIIAAVRTAPETVDVLRNLVAGTGHRAVVAADQPGFLVNHAGRGLYTEGLRILEEQCATPQDVDELMRDAAGFRMGPFELLDLTGLDVSGKVMESIYQQFQQEPRFRPSSLVAPRIAAGLYGRKSGAGWYRYDGEKKITAPALPMPRWEAGARIWIDDNANGRAQIKVLANSAGVELAATEAQADLIVIQPWGTDATTYCAERGFDARRTVAVDPLPVFERRRTLMLTIATTVRARDLAHALFASDGVAVTLINDSPGFVVQRVLATIVNIAANIAQRGIASVADLEDAVRLGLGYPQGPLEIGDTIGGARVLTILDNMQRLTGDPRYRPSLWLRRRVALGRSLRSAEAPRQ